MMIQGRHTQFLENSINSIFQNKVKQGGVV